jgi:hypothetical protein
MLPEPSVVFNSLIGGQLHPSQVLKFSEKFNSRERRGRSEKSPVFRLGMKAEPSPTICAEDNYLIQ